MIEGRSKGWGSSCLRAHSFSAEARRKVERCAEGMGHLRTGTQFSSLCVSLNPSPSPNPEGSAPAKPRGIPMRLRRAALPGSRRRLIWSQTFRCRIVRRSLLKTRGILGARHSVVASLRMAAKPRQSRRDCVLATLGFGSESRWDSQMATGKLWVRASSTRRSPKLARRARG